MTEILTGLLCCLGGFSSAIALLAVAGMVRNAGGRRWKQ
jgi:hypothetical protein